MDEEEKLKIKDILGIYNKGGASKYLGLPECFNGSKKDMLAYIHYKLKARLSCWFAISLSQGGKEILLKAMAMAMPVYVMSCFKLPKSTYDALTSVMSHYWWSSLEHKRKVHWVAWDRLCLPKDQGGLGFRDIECFNQALLTK